MSKAPSKRDIEIHRIVCSYPRGVTEAANRFGISQSTVRRAADRVSEYDGDLTEIMEGK